MTDGKSEKVLMQTKKNLKKYGLFTIYMGKPFGSRFGQLVSKIPYCGSPFGAGVYHLHKSLPI